MDKIQQHSFQSLEVKDRILGLLDFLNPKNYYFS